MSLFDALGLLDIIDVVTHWRFFVPCAIGVGAGLAVYHFAHQDPAAAAVAFGFGIAGFIVGLVWQVSHGRRQ